MKKIKSSVVTLLCAAVIAGLTACDADPVELKGGKLPDKDGLENTYGMLRSNRSSGNEAYVLLTEGGGFVTDNIYYQITKPSAAGLSVEARVDPSLLEAYNNANETQYELLPEANYEFPDGKALEVSGDARKSSTKRIKFHAGDLTPGKYLLPVTVADAGQKGGKPTLYYTLTIREPQLGDHELDPGDQVYVVFYINTKDYQPLLVDDYFMSKEDAKTYEEVWYRTIGNIVNLRTVTLDYEAQTGRAKLNLGSDMRYVLDHYVKYVTPLQEKGRKVCLCLEGGGKGLGFCNLTGEQIKDFVAQVKAVVVEYGLDGVNLWDRNSGYGKEGMPAMNTTSYPELIVAMHDMLKELGDDKILTLTDYMEPTAYFWDTTATGGIEVGRYLDYAWSGYNSEEMLTQIVDPWHQGEENVSTDYPRKPIAGLAPAKYGCINVPWYTQSSESKDFSHVLNWKLAGFKQSNILVYRDLRTVLQDAYEGSWDVSGIYTYFADDGRTGPGRRDYLNRYNFDLSQLSELETGVQGYGKWLKDW